ncbi:MAG: tetratricopeptide repeat protein [Flavobacteriales bacterium]|nr:hypothetical protein [Flavobacteriales bacterium]MCC6575871.1 tetratricopeptide repeat protein [Flavobacteriales bacterium]NUQ14170.1 tetratricopeptide repeat protein [Flavobacteriales bacterium]
MMRVLLLPALLLLAAASVPVRAQDGTDEQLAAQYFQSGDHEKAILYYERLYRRQPNAFFYEQLYKSHLALKDYPRAEKLAREQMKRDSDPRYAVDLGVVLRLAGEEDKARQQFEKVLRGMRADQNGIRQVANAFIRHNEHDLALEAYQRGQRLLKEGPGFQFEIANLYAMKGDVPAMTSAYLDLLTVNEGYIQAVQNGLSRAIDFTRRDGNTDALRTELLRRIQRNPERSIHQELLIWMYIQQKDLEGAFVQCKALDKRFDEGGARLMDLAGIALGNGDHATAMKCYDHVVGLGRRDGLYAKARMGQVRTEMARLTAMADPPAADLAALRTRYEATLDELGRSKATLELMEDLARVQAYYLNDRTAATALLEQALALPDIDAAARGRIKLQLGDVHLFDGDIWEASLLYSQVDLDFKHDPLGHEARLRNAKVSFYAGDFLWAKGQLDVLKASTSKLIANDAMELSLLISDHIGADSNSTPLALFAQADLLTFQRRFPEAVAVLDSLDRAYPMDGIADDVLFLRHRIARDRKAYAEAAGYLERIVAEHPLDILVDNALFELGRLYEEQLKDPAKAMSFYEKLLFEQPGSIFVPEARARFRRLRGDAPDTGPTDGQATPPQ